MNLKKWVIVRWRAGFASGGYYPACPVFDDIYAAAGIADGGGQLFYAEIMGVIANLSCTAVFMTWCAERGFNGAH